jgi:integrase
MALFKKPIPFAISREEIYELGKRLHNQEQRALFYTLYVTGARVSEALQIPKRDIQREIQDGREVCRFTVMTLKKKSGNASPRGLSVPIEGIEGEMVKEILSYWDSINEPDTRLFHYSRTRVWNLFSHLRVDIRAVTPQKEFIDLLGFKIHPHYLRHCRATHFAVYWGWNNPYDFMKWFGWEDANRPMTYIQLDWKDWLKKFPAVGRSSSEASVG